MVVICIYLARNDNSKSIIRKAETRREMKSKGTDDDSNSVQLVEKLLSSIAKESPSDRIHREVELTRAIHRFRRKTNETMEAYPNRLEVSIAEYV